MPATPLPRPTLALLLLVAALTTPAVTPPAHACAPAPPPGYDVTIQGEEAVIVWDAAAGIEHFIRRAEFETEAPGFGFIVPTPTVPELAEAPDALFSQLARSSAPEVRTRTETSGIRPSCTLLMTARDDAMVRAERAVEVLRHQQVAGYDAVVLAARDPQALVQWLAANGYAHSDDLVQWAAPYVEQSWTFTAFKLTAPEDVGGLSTSAVRMSFRTERPFYPYREPAGQRQGPTPPDRTLRVFFVSDQRYAGALEGAGAPAWPGRTTYARALPPDELSSHLPGLAPGAAYLTVFVDRSNPRPGTADLWFRPSEDATDVIPEPIVHTRRRPLELPIDLVVLLALPIAGTVLLLRRRRRRARR